MTTDETRDDLSDHYRRDWRNHLRSTSNAGYWIARLRSELAEARQRRLEREALRGEPK